jgi:hydrogenase expression/formation protein HypE
VSAGRERGAAIRPTRAAGERGAAIRPTRAAGDRGDAIRLAHGSGGRAMRALVEEVFVKGLATPRAAARDADHAIGLDALDDGAALRVGERWLVFTTDSHVVQPAFFPGGDIGRLAVSGTVNDLAVMGATDDAWLALGAVLEEGFARRDLERIRTSIHEACAESGSRIVTGDTKVMPRGELDGIVLHTTGVAFADRLLPDAGLRPGDRLLVTGTLGDHGFAILAAREELDLGGELRSDVAPVGGLVRAALDAGGPGVVAAKDPTRGGLSSALHEMAAKSRVGVVLRERDVPLHPAVGAAAELLGIDPLHVASEGKAVLGVAPEAAEAVLEAIRRHPLGGDAAIVGHCVAEHAGSVVLDTGFGRRLLAEPDDEIVPRIC